MACRWCLSCSRASARSPATSRPTASTHRWTRSRSCSRPSGRGCGRYSSNGKGGLSRGQPADDAGRLELPFPELLQYLADRVGRTRNQQATAGLRVGQQFLLPLLAPEFHLVAISLPVPVRGPGGNPLPDETHRVIDHRKLVKRNLRGE